MIGIGVPAVTTSVAFHSVWIPNQDVRHTDCDSYEKRMQTVQNVMRLAVELVGSSQYFGNNGVREVRLTIRNSLAGARSPLPTGRRAHMVSDGGLTQQRIRKRAKTDGKFNDIAVTMFLQLPRS